MKEITITVRGADAYGDLGRAETVLHHDPEDPDEVQVTVANLTTGQTAACWYPMAGIKELRDACNTILGAS
jgi:hypothetical protein